VGARHLERLAQHARAAGSSAEEDARAYCSRTLAAHGFSVTREAFDYSALPGQIGTPLAGALALVMFLAAGHVGYREHPWIALAILLSGGVGIATGAWWLAARGVLGCPWRRARSINLVAVRGEPRVWLVAHLDSKSQPVPIVVRALGVTTCIVVWCVALAWSLAQGAGASLAIGWIVIAIAGALGAIPVAASLVRERSAGALDNASGVAAVLTVVARLRPGVGVGVVLTSAEELGLAGARAWVRGRATGVAINFDGIDDTGSVHVSYRRRPPARLLAAFARASAGTGVPTRNGRVPSGVLVDGVALADAGWEVVTLSRGTWRTVARIHTPRDDLAHLTGSGIADLARLVVRVIEELT
jgi:hypothetical protein